MQWTDRETACFLDLMVGETEDGLDCFDMIKSKKCQRAVRGRHEGAAKLRANGSHVHVKDKCNSLLSRDRQVEDHIHQNNKSGNNPMPESKWHKLIAVIMGHRASTRSAGLSLPCPTSVSSEMPYRFIYR